MLRQMRLLYRRSNRLDRLLSKCSKTVLIQLSRSFCLTLPTFSKLRVAYNKVYRKIICLCRRSSANEMFVTNNILNSEALMKKSTFAFASKSAQSKNLW